LLFQLPLQPAERLQHPPSRPTVCRWGSRCRRLVA
jgi:hypothetical protein